jgi:serine/threonine protein kinase
VTGDPYGLAGRCLEDRYDVHEAVAEGGFGVVYRATHASLRKPVALKVLKPDGGDGGERMRDFAREARILARLDHPAIARVLDLGVSTLPSGHRAPWMALDWIEGETLAAWLASHRGERLPRAACLRCMRPVLEGVAAAHALGVAHRDIKPANLLRAPGDGTLRLVDFGVARAFEEAPPTPSGETQTTTARPAFSPAYAAPEQLAGTRTGPWTDVHALALVITELLTGERPYPADDPMALHLEVLSRTRPTPAARGVDAGPWEPVLARALALQPAARYPDARALLDALVAAEAAPGARRWLPVAAASLALTAAAALAARPTPPPARPAAAPVAARTPPPPAPPPSAPAPAPLALRDAAGPDVPRAAPRPAHHRAPPVRDAAPAATALAPAE